MLNLKLSDRLLSFKALKILFLLSGPRLPSDLIYWLQDLGVIFTKLVFFWTPRSEFFIALKRFRDDMLRSVPLSYTAGIAQVTCEAHMWQEIAWCFFKIVQL